MYNQPMAGKAGRPRKPKKDLKVQVGIRVSPSVKREVMGLAVKWDSKLSNAGGRLIEAGILAETMNTDPQLRDLMKAWGALSFEDRDRLVRTAQSWISPDPPASRLTDPFPDPFDGMDTHHDGPPDHLREYWERDKK